MKCFESPLIDPNWTQQEKDDYLKNYRDPRIMLPKYYGDYGIPLGKNFFIPLNSQTLLTIIPLAIIAYLVVRK